MKYFKEFYRFLKHVLQSRELLKTLIKNDFKKQYFGSYLGLMWAFIQPLSFMLVIWFVFEVGFRTGPTTGNTPFFLWLMSGMIPWFFIANAVNSGCNSVVGKAFLVKKVSFRVSLLPLVDIASAFLIHIVLVFFLMVTFLINGFMPSLYWLQLPYYMLCTIILLLGLSWLTSSIRVFIKDIGNFITIILQLGFWATPIFWQINMIPDKYQWILKLNPAFYIIEGYRNVFINRIWFWETSSLTLYFFGISFTSLVIGALVFKRLRPHFGDVL